MPSNLVLFVFDHLTSRMTVIQTIRGHFLHVAALSEMGKIIFSSKRVLMLYQKMTILDIPSSFSKTQEAFTMKRSIFWSPENPGKALLSVGRCYSVDYKHVNFEYLIITMTVYNTNHFSFPKFMGSDMIRFKWRSELLNNAPYLTYCVSKFECFKHSWNATIVYHIRLLLD